MRIGDAAAVTGTTPRALRFYEERGLLTVPRTPSGQREYGPPELGRIRTIRLLLSLGLTVEDVHSSAARLDAFEGDGLPAHGGPACDASQGIAAARLAALDSEIARLTVLRTRLAEALALPCRPTTGGVPGGREAADPPVREGLPGAFGTRPPMLRP
ncbi:DNA-binding transcriptional MerR regulator [Actinocorallia herbida]|uniref:DNA-binding transcriptional MerR regulator n=1 Tax=Actinocorallia herbida TaxID=58109 RepID=A0A3N1CVT5_9ACTN|nr:MerR family transcriptional regulator [Actinocorallia herbida]ROO85413.1 DNA-binding transcriptional MerR regulator [Actinocorallia herbida]